MLKPKECDPSCWEDLKPTHRVVYIPPCVKDGKPSLRFGEKYIDFSSSDERALKLSYSIIAEADSIEVDGKRYCGKITGLFRLCEEELTLPLFPAVISQREQQETIEITPLKLR